MNNSKKVVGNDKTIGSEVRKNMDRDKSIECISKPKENVEKLNLRDLVNIARSGFGSEMDEADVRAHTLFVDFLHLIRQTNNIIGFASYNSYAIQTSDKYSPEFTLNGTKILYLSGIVISKEYQGNGFFSMSLRKAVIDENPQYVVMRTQNPKVYHALVMSNVLSEVYPTVGVSFPPMAFKVIAIKIAKEIKMYGIDENNFVERGTYGKSLYTIEPRSTEENVNKLFDSELGVDKKRGDSVLLVGRVKDEILTSMRR